MTTNKVVLPKGVAKAIEEARKVGQKDVNTVKNSLLTHPEISFNKVIAEWVDRDLRKVRELTDALEYGYEVEATPEERLRTYYRGLDGFDVKQWHEAKGIRTTLVFLGITIEGINGVID